MNLPGLGRATRAACVVLMLVQVVAGMAWTAAHVGAVAEYGDSAEYLELARTRHIDAYRGVVYPVLLATVDAIGGGHDLLTWHPGDEGGLRRDVAVLQLAQWLTAVAALGYFMVVLGGPSGTTPRPRFRTTAGAVALLLFDPLLAHFNLSVLTDGLTLSASLIVTAAMTDFVVGFSPSPISAGLLTLATLTTAGLRAEKPVVLLATATLSAVCWWVASRGLPAAERRRWRRRGTLAAALVLVATAVMMGYQSRVRVPGTRMDIADWVVSQRLVFPHLDATYDELPAGVRSRVSRDMAQRFDVHVNDARTVLDDASGGDPVLRRDLLRQMASVVIPQWWPAIAFDIAKDATENIVAPVSFYTRLAAATIFGSTERRTVGPAMWTYTRLALRHPALSALYVVNAAALLVATLLFVALGDDAAPPPAPADRRWPLGWVPVTVMVVMNAGAFALTSDLVHVRYVLLAHAVLLLVLFREVLSRRV